MRVVVIGGTILLALTIPSPVLAQQAFAAGHDVEPLETACA